MKKMDKLKPYSLVVAGFTGLIMTLFAFWDFGKNVKDINSLAVSEQGISTCWNRINQTFTALMIRDVKSPYLNRGFLATSDECLGEVGNQGGLIKSYLGKDYEIFSKFMSDVNWFHEDVLKTHGPMISGSTPVSTEKLEKRYAKLEDSKLTLIDSFGVVKSRLHEISSNDRIVMGAGLFLILLSISLMGIKEYEISSRKKSHEALALNLLSSGQSKLGAWVDSLMIEALRITDLKITEQIFRDYHENLLEIMSGKMNKPNLKEAKEIISEANNSNENDNQNENIQTSIDINLPKVSLKEVSVSIENIHSSSEVQFSDFRDALVEVDPETCEQIFNSIINKLDERKEGKRKIIISNQIHTDKAIVHFFLSGGSFNAGELEFLDQKNKSSLILDDMNLMILKELTSEINAGLHIENKQDKSGKISGMSVKLILNRIPKDKAKLVAVVRGKKKDIARQMSELSEH